MRLYDYLSGLRKVKFMGDLLCLNGSVTEIYNLDLIKQNEPGFVFGYDTVQFISR